MLTPDPFNYQHLLVRTDPTCHGANTTKRIAIRLDTEALMAGNIENTLPVIAGIWAKVTPDADTAVDVIRPDISAAPGRQHVSEEVR